MLVTPSFSDIEEIITSLLSWVPDCYRLDIIKNIIDEDMLTKMEDEIADKLRDEIYEDVRDNELQYYVHEDDVEEQAEQLAKERFKEERQQLDSEIDYWKTRYYDIEAKLQEILQGKRTNLND